MPISLPTALLVGGVASAGAGVAGSALASSAQAGAAKSAQQLQAEEAANALAFQKQEFATQQQNEAPFLKAGTGAVNTLSGLLSTPGQGLLTPWTGTFTPPTAAQAQATPGYQFALGQGEEAIQNSAAARGGLLSGGTAKALDSYATGMADTNYQQVYNNALNQYQLGYNQFEQNQSNQYNRLAGLAGTGQVATQQLGQEGSQAAQNVGNIDLTTGAQQGNSINLGGAATASGYAGGANALMGGANNLTQLALLQQLLSGSNSGSQTLIPGM